MTRSTDVFVIGGGPAGLAAAIAARRKGFDVTVSDTATPPVDKACGEGLMPDGLAAARALGIDLSGAPGHAFHGIRFLDAGSRASVQARFPSGEGRGIRRVQLHRILVDAAQSAGVRLQWGTRVEGLSQIRARWIVGADGGNSAVRRWTGLDAAYREDRRYGFRRHFRVADPGDFMELHWGTPGQLYITPVSERELCVVLISRDQKMRLSAALPAFPKAAARLSGAEPLNLERGGLTVSRKLRAVAKDNVALVGDASGSVDAITGEGLCLLFQQAGALSAALAAEDLSLYQTAHRKIGRRPQFMSDLMLMLDGRRRLRQGAIRLMEFEPRLFARLLAMHVGEFSL